MEQGTKEEEDRLMERRKRDRDREREKEWMSVKFEGLEEGGKITLRLKDEVERKFSADSGIMNAAVVAGVVVAGFPTFLITVVKLVSEIFFQEGGG